MKGRQDCDAVDRVGLRLALRKAQVEAGNIALLFADESEALRQTRKRTVGLEITAGREQHGNYSFLIKLWKYNMFMATRQIPPAGPMLPACCGFSDLKSAA